MLARWPRVAAKRIDLSCTSFFSHAMRYRVRDTTISARGKLRAVDRRDPAVEASTAGLLSRLGLRCKDLGNLRGPRNRHTGEGQVATCRPPPSSHRDFDCWSAVQVRMLGFQFVVVDPAADYIDTQLVQISWLYKPTYSQAPSTAMLLALIPLIILWTSIGAHVIRSYKPVTTAHKNTRFRAIPSNEHIFAALLFKIDGEK